MPADPHSDRTPHPAESRDAARDLAVTLQSIGNAVIATDADGLVTRMNPSAERLTGWTALDATGRPASEVIRLVSASTRTPVPDLVGRVLGREATIELSNEVMLVRRDGTLVPVADSAAPIRGDEGAVFGVVVVWSSC